MSSDVWSLGLSIIEIAMGRYPYPPETYSNVFAQLQAIVHGDPPVLPEVKPRTDGDPLEVHFSEEARDWVRCCLIKDPTRRATYAELLVGFLPLFTRPSELTRLRNIHSSLLMPSERSIWLHGLPVLWAAVKYRPNYVHRHWVQPTNLPRCDDVGSPRFLALIHHEFTKADDYDIAPPAYPANSSM